MSDFGPDRYNLSEKYELKMIVFLGVFDGKVDSDFIFFEFDLQFFFLLHNKRNLDAHFRGSLIPRVSELGSKEFVLEHIFLPHLDHCPLVEGLLSRLPDLLNQGGTHL